MNTAARLLEPIKEAADDDSPMSPEIASRVVRLFREFRPPEHASSFTRLRNRTLEVFDPG